MDFGILSIIPPIIAIGLALLTKEVIISLLVGVLSGAFIYSSYNIIGTVETTFSIMTDKMSGNSSMILFLALLGALVAVVTMAGGSEAYGKWASKKIKSKSGASLATAGLGLLIFIDDYFNCLTVGTVMRPVTDKNGISRAKLAYIIDSTAAPICILAPVSSWAASVISTIGDTGVVADPLNMFMSSIPFNLYALLTIATVIFFSFSKRDIGAMADPSLIETSINNEADIDKEFDISKNGTVLDLVIPIVSLIFFTVLSMLYTGGFFDGVGIAAAFGDSAVNMSLVYGAFAGILIAFLMYIPRKLVSFQDFMKAITVGVKSMLPAIMILILAWSIGGISSGDYLNTGGFIGSIMQTNNISLAFLPSIVFFFAGFLAFATGTAWGTFGILIPILVPILVSMGSYDMLPIILGAIFSGSVFGDHCSPISDTTILSSAGAGCKHIVHVSTQIPYAFTVAASAFIGFIVGGITNNIYASFISASVVLAAIIFVRLKTTKTKA